MMLLEKDPDQKGGMIKMNWDFKETNQAGRCVDRAGLLELYSPNTLFIKLYGSNFLSPCHPPSWHRAECAYASLGLHSHAAAVLFPFPE